MLRVPRWHNPIGRMNRNLIRLGVIVTIPVLLVVSASGLLASLYGRSALWTGLAAGLVLSIAAYGLSLGSGPFLTRFVLPVVFYLPPLLLAGLCLSTWGQREWTPAMIGLVAVGTAAANILLAPVFFLMGGALGAWETSL
jgi:hypothetical protein